MFLGDFQLGRTVILDVQTTNASGTPTVPDDAPTCRIYSAAGALVQSKLMPVVEPEQVTGLFGLPVFLGLEFATGYYLVLLRWAISGTTYAEARSFRIVAGGDVEGAVVDMHWFQRPHANYLVHVLESGYVRKGQNPSLT